jgi:hypothetical protein
MIDWPLEIIHSPKALNRFSNYPDSGQANGISSDDAHSLWYPTILNEKTPQAEDSSCSEGGNK